MVGRSLWHSIRVVMLESEYSRFVASIGLVRNQAAYCAPLRFVPREKKTGAQVFPLAVALKNIDIGCVFDAWCLCDIDASSTTYVHLTQKY